MITLHMLYSLQGTSTVDNVVTQVDWGGKKNILFALGWPIYISSNFWHPFPYLKKKGELLTHALELNFLLHFY